MRIEAPPGSDRGRPASRMMVPGGCAAGLLLIAQQVLLWWLYYHAAGKQLVGDEHHYLASAQAILAGGAWHPGDIWPPGQAVFIAAIAWMTSHVVLGVQLVQTLLFLGCGVLTWHLWTRLTGNNVVGLLAAALFVLAPSNAAYAHYLWPEIPHLFALLLALELLLPGPPGRVAAFFAGVSIGMALLFKSLLTAFWPIFLVCFIGWRPLRVRWMAAALFTAGVAIMLAPALIAGHRNTGHWRVADSSGINLLIGLDDVARNDYVPGPSAPLFGEYERSGTTSDARNAWAWQQIHERIDTSSPASLLAGQLGRQYFRLFESKTLLLTQLPGPRCAGYLGSYPPTSAWITTTLRWSSHLAHAAMLIGFALGLCLHRHWRKPWLWLMLAMLGYQFALYLGLHVQARYLLPMVPIFCGFSALAIVRLWPACLHPESRTGFPAYRLLAGMALAALFLMLAFAGPWIDGYCRIQG